MVLPRLGKASLLEGEHLAQSTGVNALREEVTIGTHVSGKIAVERSLLEELSAQRTGTRPCQSRSHQSYSASQLTAHDVVAF